MKFFSLLALFGMCAAAQIQPGTAQVPATAAAKAALSGRVVNAVTGEPLRKVSVLLAGMGGRGSGREQSQEPPQARSATTDDQGVFAFTGLDPGSYRLIASRVGFVRQVYGERDGGGGGWRGGGAGATLKAGEELKDILIRLQPSAAISGRVVDEEGEPLMHARVQALRWAYLGGRRELMPAGTAQSDDHGEYRIYSLNPGRYYLSATYEGGYMTGYLAGIGVDVTDQAYVPVFYPGVNDPTQASVIQVRGGDEVPGINFAIVPQRAVTVAGRVFNAITGQAAKNVHVGLNLRSPGARGFFRRENDTTTDQQGAFRFRGIAPGSYIATAEWDSDGQGPGMIGSISVSGSSRVTEYGRGHYTGRQSVDVVSADVEGVSIVIAPGIDLTGAVKVEGTLPQTPEASPPRETVVMGTRVIRSMTQSRMRIVLEADDDQSMGNVVAEVNPDNTFVFNNVPEGAYRVSIAGVPGTGYLKSARIGGQDVLTDGLIVTRGRRGALELVISTLTGTLDGTVVDSAGKPFNAARVVLVPEGARRKTASLYRLATSDAYGRFALRAIPPGEYKVFAWDVVDGGAWQDPEFLRPFEDYGQRVHVTENGQHNAEVKVIITEEAAAQ